MATIDLGKIKFNWKGAYASGTAYVVDDVVEYNGSSYICILASTGNLPTDATYWETMAEGGDVATTLTTQGDILYRDGSGLARLGAGTSGQVLQTGGTGANPSWTTISGYADSDALSLFNASGSAPVYAVRAWVNFNGTGTVAIRDSGNVSSITDNGTGDYTVNFTTAIEDSDYAILITSSGDGTGDNRSTATDRTANSTTSAKVYSFQSIEQTLSDDDVMCVGVIR